ncbi:hypothetical protein P7E15_15120 [Enterococcus gallinarum]|nr:hypothetical protein [Enterococcus gallinarum]
MAELQSNSCQLIGSRWIDGKWLLQLFCPENNEKSLTKKGSDSMSCEKTGELVNCLKMFKNN